VRTRLANADRRDEFPHTKLRSRGALLLPSDTCLLSSPRSGTHDHRGVLGRSVPHRAHCVHGFRVSLRSPGTTRGCTQQHISFSRRVASEFCGECPRERRGDGAPVGAKQSLWVRIRLRRMRQRLPARPSRRAPASGRAFARSGRFVRCLTPVPLIGLSRPHSGCEATGLASASSWQGVLVPAEPRRRPSVRLANRTRGGRTEPEAGNSPAPAHRKALCLPARSFRSVPLSATPREAPLSGRGDATVHIFL
jgi:hypothetical protein